MVDAEKRLVSIRDGLILALQAVDIKDTHRIVRDVFVLVVDLMDNMPHVATPQAKTHISEYVTTDMVEDYETGEYLDAILEEIKDKVDIVDSNLDSLIDKVDEKHKFVEAQKDRITSLEKRIQELEDYRLTGWKKMPRVTGPVFLELPRENGNFI